MTKIVTVIDREAEDRILGIMLMNPEVVADVAKILAPEDFYSEVNGVFFAAVVNINSAGKTHISDVVHDLRKTTSPVPRGPSVLDAFGWTTLAYILYEGRNPDRALAQARYLKQTAELRRRFPDAAPMKSDWAFATDDPAFATFILCKDEDARFLGCEDLLGTAMAVIASRTLMLDEQLADFQHGGMVTAGPYAEKYAEIVQCLNAIPA